jgi:rhomboid protease GluP
MSRGWSTSFYLTGEDFKHARLTYFLIGINIFLFLVFNVIMSFFLNQSEAIFILAQNNEYIQNGQKIWSLFTSMFVHYDIAHLLSNIIALIFYGVAAEKIYRYWEYILIYIVSGLIGSIFFYIFQPQAIGLGASGAIYGLMVAVLFNIGRDNPTYFVLSIFYVSYRLFGGTRINYAHLFGALGGLIIMIALKWRDKRKYKALSVGVSTKTNNRKDTSSGKSDFNLAERIRTLKSKKSKRNKQIKVNSKYSEELNFLQDLRDRLVMHPELSIDEAALLLGIPEKDLLKRILIWQGKLAFHYDKGKIIVDDKTELVLQIDNLIDKWEKKFE